MSCSSSLPPSNIERGSAALQGHAYVCVLKQFNQDVVPPKQAHFNVMVIRIRWDYPDQDNCSSFHCCNINNKNKICAKLFLVTQQPVQVRWQRRSTGSSSSSNSSRQPSHEKELLFPNCSSVLASGRFDSFLFSVSCF
ncbi:uncharacterized protein LOC131677135 isoform X5 [Topomyia yanbarensis]|uniref:uncharacterized protein LOC131677135 isoform X5 n=1 Tax=Topomyia yanbarensis TaxID=2498891 RepID=UPI00273CB630|nr:uncharacterized protein LOC131677135 isoform X5 [Topomyia yanbarensis]